MKRDLVELKRLLLEYSYLGERHVPETGAHLIGHVPHVAPEAWLHIIWEPLSDIREAKERIGKDVPAAFVEFLSLSNGLSMFSDAISIYGVRKNWKRTGDWIFQPFDLKLPNNRERPLGLPKSFVVVGSYGWDGSKICLSETGEVVRCERWGGKILYSWPEFSSMLLNEAHRLKRFFDDSGRQLCSDEKTVPSD